LALATGGPVLWLFHLNTIAAYSVAWGAVVAVSIRFTVDHRWLRGGRWVLIAAYVTPVTIMALWAAATSMVITNPLAGWGCFMPGKRSSPWRRWLLARLPRWWVTDGPPIRSAGIGCDGSPVVERSPAW